MSSRLILRIQERQKQLTPSERKIAQVLLGNQGLVETHTATELASMAGVSKATAARFFRSLGYTDFDEARLQAREERNRCQPYSRVKANPEPVDLRRTISDHLDLELNNLVRTFEEMRSDLLPSIASILGAAPRVWFLGFGNEYGIGKIGKSLFSQLRHDVHQLEGTGQNWATELSMTGPKDVLILLTFEPRPKLLRAFLAHAHTTRMQIITITDHNFAARARKFSDIVLPCHIANYSVIPTHAAMLSILRLVAVAYLDQNYNVARRRIDTLSAINEELGLSE